MPRAYEQDGVWIKRCCRCDAVKPVDEFTMNRNTYDGHAAYCRICTRAAAKARKAKLREDRPYKITRAPAPFERDGCMVKRCVRCQEVKLVDDFTDRSDGHKVARCKMCVSVDKREYHARWLARSTPEMKAKRRAYGRAQYHKHRDKSTTYRTEYSRRPEVRQRMNERKRERRAIDIDYRLASNAACMIRVALKKQTSGKPLTKDGRTAELIGCSIPDLRIHLERQFTEGMGWDKIGHQRGMIHIDHILPRVLFDLSDGRHQRACFRYTNLRPMWSEDNMAKSDLLDDGRRAGTLTAEEKQAYLTRKGLGHLFDGTPPEPPYDMWPEPRPSRFKAVIRSDGKRYESMQAAERDIDTRRGFMSGAVRSGRARSGYRFILAEGADGRPFEEVYAERHPTKARI